MPPSQADPNLTQPGTPVPPPQASQPQAPQEPPELPAEMPAPELTAGAIYKRLYRVMQPDHTGAYKVPQEFVDQWNDKIKRDKLIGLFEKCNYEAARGCPNQVGFGVELLVFPKGHLCKPPCFRTHFWVCCVGTQETTGSVFLPSMFVVEKGSMALLRDREKSPRK